jgi:hypothetical protein
LSDARAMRAGSAGSDWIPLTHAAKLAACTPYTVKTATIGGLIKARVLPGFPTLYSRADVLAFANARA